MAGVRWTGDGDREVLFPVEEDGSKRIEHVAFKRLEWQDVPQAIALSLNEQDGWELEAVKKAAKTRAAKGEE